MGCIIVLILLALMVSDLEGRGGEICFMVAASLPLVLGPTGDLGIAGLRTGDAAFACNPTKGLAGTGEEELLAGLKRD
jgi:hypothetical protein